MSELLARTVSRKALDQDLSVDDRQALLNFLKVYGDLNADFQYKGSVRSGYTRVPGAGDQTGVTRAPLELQTLLNPKLWGALVFDEIPEFSSTMFQPVGGMDRIPYAFYDKLKDAVRFNAEVSDIQTSENGSRITYRDRKTGKTQTLNADYAVVTVPLPLLAKLPSNFSPPFKQAILSAQSDQANKVAWQSPRFWETDFNIYGGLSYLDHEVKGLWYPSDRLNSAQGFWSRLTTPANRPNPSAKKPSPNSLPPRGKPSNCCTPDTAPSCKNRWRSTGPRCLSAKARGSSTMKLARAPTRSSTSPRAVLTWPATPSPTAVSASGRTAPPILRDASSG